MGNCIVAPSELRGIVTPPPSKSLVHRAMLCAGLAKGRSLIENVALSDDILATAGALHALGCTLSKFKTGISVSGPPSGGIAEIDCAESGSTLRFVLPVALALGGEYVFKGRGDLGKRPMAPFYRLFDQQHIVYEAEKEAMNLHVRGRLSPGVFRIDGGISSQFVSGLLFAAPLMGGDCEIIIEGGLQSKGYIDLTPVSYTHLDVYKRQVQAP